MTDPKIIYTFTDEAPALATCSLLPIIQAFASTAGVHVETRDISLAGRIIASFPEHLQPAQRMSDDLAELGALAQKPEALSSDPWEKGWMIKVKAADTPKGLLDAAAYDQQASSH